MKQINKVVLLTAFSFSVQSLNGLFGKNLSSFSLFKKEKKEHSEKTKNNSLKKIENLKSSKEVIKELHTIKKQQFDMQDEIKKIHETEKKLLKLHGTKGLNPDEEGEDKTPFAFLIDFNTQAYYGSNLELLNASNEFDSFGFLQYNVDAGCYLRRPKRYETSQPIEFKAIARMKGIMGNSGRYTQTTETPVKIGFAITETAHSHSINRLLIWGRELWFKYYFSSADNAKFFTLGLFPFKLGNGFALGDAHIVGQTIPGQYNYQSIDQFRPGILFSGSLANKSIKYNLYGAVISTKSDTFNATAAYTNAQSLENTGKPQRGPWKNNFVLATQIKSTMFTKENSNNKLVINPYILFNHDGEQSVEFPDDASSNLITPGISFEFEKGKFSFHAEYARNFGHQKVKNWDRNIGMFTAVTFNTHLLYANETAAVNAGVNYTHANQAAADEALATLGDANFEPSTVFTTDRGLSRSYANGEKFALLSSGTTYDFFMNSYDRFRNEYKNTYKGWMMYGDIKYTFNKWSTALSCGAFSGDENPNDSEDKIMITRITPNITYQDTNKDYKGFVSVQPMFTSKSLRSLYMFEAQKLNHPLSGTNKLTQPDITNLYFVGWNLGCKSLVKNKLIDFQTNAILFWNQNRIKQGYNMTFNEALAIDYTNAILRDPNKLLSSSLGLEINSSLQCNLTNDATLFAELALFIPGSYYKDSTGKIIPVANQINLAGTDISGIEDVSQKYNISTGTSNSLHLSCGLMCNFDTSTFSFKRKNKDKNRKRKNPFSSIRNLFNKNKIKKNEK